MKYTLPIGTYSIYSETDTTAYYDNSVVPIPAKGTAVVIVFASETDVYIPDFPNVTVISGDYTGQLMPYLAESIVTPITVNTFLKANIKDQVKISELLTAKTIEIGVNKFTRYLDSVVKQQLFGDLLYLQDNKIYFSDGTTIYNIDHTFTKGTTFDIGLVFHPTKWFLTVNNIVVSLVTSAPGTLSFPSTINFAIGKARDTLKNVIVQEAKVEDMYVITEGGDYVITDSGDNDIII
ncbi:MAG: hypothetical protein GY804_04140 [Alphaproteobacteria bacterium]|nr:hypothetical protein [Alphaproteobacteria bacterium]